MARQVEAGLRENREERVREYKEKLRRKYLKNLERVRERKREEGLFLYYGQWRSIEEIVQWSLLEKRRKDAILKDLLLLLLMLVPIFFGAVRALFRWYF